MKAAIKSKTIWINVITGLVVLFPLIAPYVGFQLKLTADQISMIAAVLCAANVWLRRVTSDAVRFFKEKDND